MRKFLLLGALIAFLLAPGLTTNAFAQCDFYVETSNMNWDRAPFLDFHAATYPELNCSGQDVKTQTEAWIYGYPKDIMCTAGTLSGDGRVCYNFMAWPYESRANPIALACGTGWTGISRHWAIFGNSWEQLGSDRSTSLLAQHCRNFTISASCNSYELWDESNQWCVPYNTPILVSTRRGQAIRLTDVIGGVTFDFGRGPVQTAWTEADSGVAFLAIDRNGNGVIDNGTELFGNHTVVGIRNGFEALDRLNQELGGSAGAIIDGTQPIYSRLLLWEDRNHNGVSESNELSAASTLLADIGVARVEHNRRDRFDNLFAYRGFAHLRTAAGRNRAADAADDLVRQLPVYDVVFASR